MSPTITIAYLPGENFQTAAQGRGTQTETGSPAKLKTQSLKFSQTKWLEFSGKNMGRRTS